MINLNLPAFDYKLREKKGKLQIWDCIRKKYVDLSPEEWVRQHVLHDLIENKDYSKSLIKVETEISNLGLRGRVDIEVWNRTGALFMIIECKRSNQALGSQEIHQLKAYTLKKSYKWGILTNGLTFFLMSGCREKRKH